MIEAKHMEAAMRRWEDFQRVQTPEPNDEEAAAYGARIKAGESAHDILQELKDEMPAQELAAALRRLKTGLGISTGASRAFWEGVGDQASSLWLSVGDMRDQAATMGLIVGLTARELAEEETSA